MDISDWPMERIMQLPDHLFGPRWLVGVGVITLFGTPQIRISNAGLPERSVIWSVQCVAVPVTLNKVSMGFRLGNVLPGSVTEFNRLEPMFGTMEIVPGARSLFTVPLGSAIDYTRLRFPVMTGGRRLVVLFNSPDPEITDAQASILISSIPREIPDLYAGFPEEKFDEMIRLLRIGVKIR